MYICSQHHLCSASVPAAGISYQNCLYNLDCLSSNGTSWSCMQTTSSLALHLLSLLAIVSANNSQKSFLLRPKLHLWSSFSIHECRIRSTHFYNSVQCTAVGSMFIMDFVEGANKLLSCKLEYTVCLWDGMPDSLCSMCTFRLASANGKFNMQHAVQEEARGNSFWTLNWKYTIVLINIGPISWIVSEAQQKNIKRSNFWLASLNPDERGCHSQVYVNFTSE